MIHLGPKCTIFSLDSIGRGFACISRKTDSSGALDSYGSLLSNAPSLVKIGAVLAMIQHERSACKTKNFRVKPIGIQRIIKGITKGCLMDIKGMSRETLGKTDNNHFDNFGFTC